MSKKITIKLSPFDAMAIRSFLDSFPKLQTDESLTALNDSRVAFNKQVFDNMKIEDYEEARRERHIHKSLGYEPEG